MTITSSFMSGTALTSTSVCLGWRVGQRAK